MTLKITFVVPVFNEEENIQSLYESVTSNMKKLEDKYNYEILFMDNCSTDKSFSIIKELANKDNHVTGIRYSRNFGYQRSIYMGYLEASGNCCIQLDCDLQDDPALIHTFIKHWEEGYRVVSGVRKKRKEMFHITLLRKIFYRVLNYLSEDYLPPDVGEFRLIDKSVIEELRYAKDHQPYLRGLIATFGFKTKYVKYERNARQRGKTKFNIKGLFKIAFDGILDHSIVPLRIASVFGFCVSVSTVILAGYYLVAKLFWSQNWPAGFTTLSILILLGMGLNAIFLGIIGEYLGRVYKQVKVRPIAIIEERTNSI